MCVLTGEGAERCVAGERANFKLVAKDYDGNPIHRGGAPLMCEARVPGEDPIAGEVVDFVDGSYEFSYVAEKAGRFFPQDVRTRYDVVQWIMWQMANQGPKTGELGHFRRLRDTQGDQSYAIRRFADEVNRMYGVLDNRLYDRRYLAGDEYTIADMAAYPWVVGWEQQGENIDDFPYFKRWFRELEARPAVQRGMAVGSDLQVDYSKLTPEEMEEIRKRLYNQRARPSPKGGLL